MDEIAQQLAIRDSFRKKLALAQTPSERMAAMARLQEATWDILRRSPEGYARFLRRNFKARALTVKGCDGA